MITALTPGWGRGPVRHLPPHLLASLPPGPPRFPAHTRAGLLERLLAPEPPPEPWRPGDDHFLAWVHALDARALLALSHAGACGVLIAGPRPERHAETLALALGLPLAMIAPDWHPRAHTRWTLDTLAEAPTLVAGAPTSTPSKITASTTKTRSNAIPLAMLPTSVDGPLPWIELIGGQEEELWLARQALERELAQGIGLLRLEYVLYADPWMEPEELSEIMARVLDACPRLPVAVRLTDWTPAKAPAAQTALSAWDGRPGLAGILETGAAAAQLAALARAARATGHRRCLAIAPRTEYPGEINKLRTMIPEPLRLGAMIESPTGLEHLEAIAAACDGLWFGLGDLGASGGGRSGLEQTIARLTREGSDWPVVVCGGWPGSTPTSASTI